MVNPKKVFNIVLFFSVLAIVILAPLYMSAIVLEHIAGAFSTVMQYWNGEVAAVCLAIFIIGGLLYTWDKDPDIDFEFIKFFKTGGQEDPYKAIYILFSLILSWGFIIMTKNKDMDVWKLIVFCAYAFGPPMFNSALKVISSVFGKAPIELPPGIPNGNGNDLIKKSEPTVDPVIK